MLHRPIQVNGINIPAYLLFEVNECLGRGFVGDIAAECHQIPAAVLPMLHRLIYKRIGYPYLSKYWFFP
ncbi:hypothetical protein SDJN02_19175, partial [Cucurbita argyrosperma subsp. argyrosperma]